MLIVIRKYEKVKKKKKKKANENYKALLCSVHVLAKQHHYSYSKNSTPKQTNSQLIREFLIMVLLSVHI
jgi:hypothetical protein